MNEISTLVSERRVLLSHVDLRRIVSLTLLRRTPRLHAGRPFIITLRIRCPVATCAALDGEGQIPRWWFPGPALLASSVRRSLGFDERRSQRACASSLLSPSAALRCKPAGSLSGDSADLLSSSKC